MNPFRWSFRGQYAAGFLVCAALMAYAIHVQFDLGIEPCPLCEFQRFALIGAGAFLPGRCRPQSARNGAPCICPADPAGRLRGCRHCCAIICGNSTCRPIRWPVALRAGPTWLRIFRSTRRSRWCSAVTATALRSTGRFSVWRCRSGPWSASCCWVPGPPGQVSASVADLALAAPRGCGIIVFRSAA